MSRPVRLDRRTARAVDRLARRAHAFHRWAHHPLCDRYAAELVPLGHRTRICRGCMAVALGIPCGLAAYLVSEPSAGAVLGASALGGALAVASFVARLPKLAGRFVPSFCGTVMLAFVLAHERTRLLALPVALGLAAGVTAYRRRGPNRSPCATCPERLGPSTCSGFASIVRRERAFRRLAQRWIARPLGTPGG